jgi:hypothetical protein
MSPTWTAGGASLSNALAAVVDTLPVLEEDVSVGFGLPTPGKIGLATERRLEALLPNVLMRLKNLLVRLVPWSSLEVGVAAPERFSSLTGTGPGVDALERPSDLRRSELRERRSGDGGFVGGKGMGGRKA